LKNPKISKKNFFSKKFPKNFSNFQKKIFLIFQKIFFKKIFAKKNFSKNFFRKFPKNFSNFFSIYQKQLTQTEQYPFAHLPSTIILIVLSPHRDCE